MQAIVSLKLGISVSSILLVNINPQIYNFCSVCHVRSPSKTTISDSFAYYAKTYTMQNVQVFNII